MLTKRDKDLLRGTLFRHLDGLVTATSAHALWKKGVLTHLLDRKTATLDELAEKFNANTGYLNVALRVLASQGWLTQHIGNNGKQVSFSVNENSKAAFSLVPHYEEPVNYLSYAVKFPNEQIGPDAFQRLDKLFKTFETHFGMTNTDGNAIEFQILKHIEGVIAGPIVVMLGMNGFFHKYFMEASFRAQEYHKDPESFKKILDFLTYLGWFKKKNDTYQFKDEGLFFAKRASAYGVTVSYLPTLIHLDDLIFGDPVILKDVAPGKPEQHVHREMNVWGSGGAHSTYFKVVDQIIIELFNKPIDEQPKGILDMGCGNGAFIQHIFDVIENQTERGKVLDEYPLFLVGVDFNEAALKVTRANLIMADIWAKVIWGDIGRPEQLAQDLVGDYNIKLSDLLNVRTFLDHNRIWEHPKEVTGRQSRSSGAYVFQGKRITNDLVEDSLLEHFQKWKPFIERFGLLIIELHTINPEITAANLGKTAVTAYDATHGYSDQFILEVDVFKDVINEAGLQSAKKYFTKFPNNDMATVSVNLLKSKN
ncbi:MAG: class I SAM-dependent methyltransferase [Flavobacteriaceae bacterium]|nr:class I SAM-dependent methyltransferase [Flavobacteriaceae bacterium]